MLPHGFQSRDKFFHYLRCLRNIREDSIISISLLNDVGTLPTVSCSVAVIINNIMSYGNGYFVDKTIVLKSRKPNFDGNSSWNFPSLVTNALFEKLGPDATSYYKYRLVNATTLVTKIDNKARPPKAPAAQRFAPPTPSLNYSIKFH